MEKKFKNMEIIQVMLNFNFRPESPGLIHGLALVCLGLELVKTWFRPSLKKVHV